MGGLLGAALAFLGVRVFLWLGPTIPRMTEIAVDGRILAITAAVSLGAGILTGLAPVFGLGGTDITNGLREGTDRGAPAGARLRARLVTLQPGLAVVLVVGASLLLHSFVRLTTMDPGFRPDDLMAFTMPVKRLAGTPAWQSWEELMAEVSITPGVTHVGVTSNLPSRIRTGHRLFAFRGTHQASAARGLRVTSSHPATWRLLESRSGRAETS